MCATYIGLLLSLLLNFNEYLQRRQKSTDPAWLPITVQNP